MDYDDGLITTTSDALVIRRYNALLQRRSIPYSDIRSVERIRSGGAGAGACGERPSLATGSTSTPGDGGSRSAS